MADLKINTQLSVDSSQLQSGLKKAQSTTASFSSAANEYLNLVPKIDSRNFEHNLNSLIAKIGQLGKEIERTGTKGEKILNFDSPFYNGKSLSTGKGKKKVTYSLTDAFLDPNALSTVYKEISKERGKGLYKGENLTLANRFISDAEEILKAWKLVNKEVDKYLQSPSRNADKRAKQLENTFNSADASAAVKAMKDREKAQKRLNVLSDDYAKKQQLLGTYNTNLYTDVRKKLTTEQKMIDILNEQATLYGLIGEKAKASNAKARSTKLQTQAEETSSRLINWTGNDKGLIASYDPSNVKKQLNAISRDLTNTIGRENILQMKVEVTGWEQSVQRFRNAIAAAERSFTVGGQKFKITGIDSAIVALGKLDKMAAKGVKNAAQWQQKLNEYLASHVDVANKYQTYQNKIIDAQKKEAKAHENVNGLLGKRESIFNNLTRLAARYFSIYTVANFGKKIAETTGYFQQQQVALEGILGSASEAQKILNDIRGFALQSPFQTKELVGFTKQLAAFGVGNNDLFPTVKKLADISAGLGVDMSRIILAYGQVKSAAVLRGQELRQFTEAGIPMVQALADKFTELNGRLVTTGEVFKLISERQVPFEMVASVLSDMTVEGGKFYKMQENITDTMYGQIQKLRDMWTLEMEKIGKTGDGFFMSIIKLLQGIIKHGRTLTTTLVAAFSVSRIAKFIAHFKGFVRLLKIAVATTGPWGAALSVISGVIAGIGMNWYSSATKVQKAMKDIDASFEKETSKMINGFDKLVNKLQSSNFGTKAYNEALSALKANYGDFLSNEMIDALVNQKKGWEDIAKSVKNAIKEVQNYNNALARSSKGADLVKEELENDGFLGIFKGAKKILNDIRINNRNLTFEDKGTLFDNTIKGSSAIDLVNMAFDNLKSNGGTTANEFNEELKKLYIEDENLRRVLLSISGEIFERLKEMDGWAKYVENLNQANNSPISIINRNFENAIKSANNRFQGLWSNLTNESKESKLYTEPSEIGKKYNPMTWEDSKQEDLINAAFEIAQSFLFGKEAARKKLEEKFAALKDKNIEDRLHGVADALNDLSETLVDGVLRERLSLLSDEFEKNARITTGEAAQVNTRIRSRIKESSEGQMKDFYMKYLASDATYKQMVEKVTSDRASAENYLKTHKRDEGAHAKEYDRVTEERKWLEDLFSNIYALKDKPKGSGAGAGGGWRRMFSELFSYIKEARAEEKKLVDHSAGLTEELANQIGSQQLEGTAVDAFWESFQKDKSPFQKIIDKFSEYGIESDVFNEKFLKEALANIRTKQIDDTGTVNFMDTWIKLTDIIKQRADELDKDSKTKSTADSLRSFLQQMTVEFEKYFGRDQVEKMINEQLKELKKLNSQFAEIRKKNELFESASDASNYLKANRFIYGTDRYQRFDAVETSREQTSKTLNLAIGKGLSNTDAGKELRQILNMSNLNIKNLEALENIRQRLVAEAAKTTLDGMPGDDEATRQANFDQFKGIMSEMDTQIKQLSNDILNEFKTVMQTASPNETRSNTFVNAVRGYQDALGLIAKAEQGKVINEKEANDKRLKALHNFFEKISGEIPQWIKTIYGENNGTTGISKTGFNVMQMFDGDLETKLKRSISKIYAEQIKGIEEKYQRRKDDYDNMRKMGGISDKEYNKVISSLDSSKASEIGQVSGAASGAMGAASGVVAMIDMIVKAIYGAIKSIVEITQTINELDEKLNHGLNMTKQKNGTYVDENGNATIDERYYQQENRWAKTKEVTDAIQTYNQHAMDGWEKLKSGDGFGAGMEIFKSITDLIGDIATIQDADIQRKQDGLIRSNEKLERAMEKLADVMKDAAGREKFDVNTDQLANLEEQKTNYQQLMELENEKKKGDDEKAQEYADKYQQAQYQINDIIRSINQDILGTADELASSLTDALTDAFMNGKNAAREWRDTVRGYVGQVLRDLLISDVMAPRIKAILEKYGIKKGETKSDQIIAKFSDANTMVNFRNELFAENAKTLDDINNLAPAIKEMMFWNNNTSELSGGIQGITEDTARTLEGLSNSMLAQLVLLNRSSSTMEGYAEMQVSQFRSLLSIQGAILDTVREFRSDFDSIRNGIRPLHVSIPRT